MISIVEQSMVAARRALLFAVVGAGMLIVGLIVERLHFQHTIEAAHDDLQRARVASDRILLVDERLTMSTHMAVATGEQRWIERYQEQLLVIDQAIADVISIAPNDVAQRFDRVTRVANDSLVALEKQALALVADGKSVEARLVLDGEDYAQHKARLAFGTDELIANLIEVKTSEMQAIKDRARFMFLTLVIPGIPILWLLLSKNLQKTQRTFRSAEKEVQELALTDPLTGVSNRRAFRETLESMLRAGADQRGRVALFNVDLKDFKWINDLFGHVEGDKVLCEVARRLGDEVRDCDVMTRLGGDEFAVALFAKENESPEMIADRLTAVISAPIDVGGKSINLGVFIGLATSSAGELDVDELMHRADLALRHAKSGDRSIRGFDPSMDEELKRRAQLEEELLAAVSNNEIFPHFQPLIDLRNNRLTGFEILARWNHPERGFVPPDEFIAIAEETRCIDELTRSMLLQACACLQQWPSDLMLALNVTSKQVKDLSLPDMLTKVIKQSGVEAQRICIEVTEHSLIEDFEQASLVIDRIKHAGMSVALDDFGVGYSSFSRLSRLGFDKIKIDRSFVRHMDHGGCNRKIVKNIIQLGQSLGIKIVAEGIETDTVAIELARMGCTFGQGYHYSKPVPAGAVVKLIDALSQNKKPASLEDRNDTEKRSLIGALE